VTVSVNEAKVKKAELELAIATAVTEFHMATGCTVDAVFIECAGKREFPSEGIYRVQAEVKL